MCVVKHNCSCECALFSVVASCDFSAVASRYCTIVYSNGYRHIAIAKKHMISDSIDILKFSQW